MAKRKKENINTLAPKNSLFIVRLSLPDLIALSGIMISLISILHSHYGRLEYALAFMFVAMLTDSLNVFFTRLFKLERLFGRYLDGFINFMIYVIAPVVFLYYFGFERLKIVWILLLFGACAVVRLSVYDQIGDIKTGKNEFAYLGMPVFWSHFIVTAFYGLSYLIKGDLVVYLAAAVMFLSSFLMLLNRKFPQVETKPYMFAAMLALISLFLWLGIMKGSPLF